MPRAPATAPLAAALAATLLGGAALADGQLDAAISALRGDDSLKVRTQAALVLGQRAAPEAIAALRQAVVGDAAAAVRLAAVTALARLGPRAGRIILKGAAQADADAAVRAAAGRAVAAFGPVALQVRAAPSGGVSGPARLDLAATLGRHLAEAGLLVAEPAELILTPTAAVEVGRADGKAVVAVKASLSVVDADGRVDLLERTARASLPGPAAEPRLAQLATRAADAALHGLCEDLAARIAGR